MRIEVRLFAAARDVAGQESASVELSPGASVADLRQALAERYPGLAELVAHSMIAIDMAYARDTERVQQSAEIALIPPVSGG